jgi:lipoprotein
MKLKYSASILALVLLTACSTNPDGSINWSDNPLNAVATQVDKGVQNLNRQTDRALPNAKPHCNTCDPHGVTHQQMLEWGYIRRNPDYPRRSNQRYVFTSKNCDRTRQTLCFHPSKDIAERP